MNSNISSPPNTTDQPNYGAKIQFYKKDTAAPFSATQIIHIKRVVGNFFYYSRVMDNTMLHALKDIASSKSKGTQTT